MKNLPLHSLLALALFASSIVASPAFAERTYTSYGWGQGYMSIETSCEFVEFADALSEEEMARYADEIGSLRIEGGLKSGLLARLDCTKLIESGVFDSGQYRDRIEKDRIVLVTNPRIIDLLQRTMESNDLIQRTMEINRGIDTALQGIAVGEQYVAWAATSQSWWVKPDVIYPVEWVQLTRGDVTPYEQYSYPVTKLVVGAEAVLFNPPDQYTVFKDEAQKCPFFSPVFMVLLWNQGVSNQKALDALVRVFFGEPVAAIPQIVVDEKEGCNDANGLYIFVQSKVEGIRI